jgi:hypothetical protein
MEYMKAPKVAQFAQGVLKRVNHKNTVTDVCCQKIALQKNDRKIATHKHPYKVTDAATSHYN